MIATTQIRRRVEVGLHIVEMISTTQHKGAKVSYMYDKTESSHISSLKILATHHYHIVPKCINFIIIPVLKYVISRIASRISAFSPQTLLGKAK